MTELDLFGWAAQSNGAEVATLLPEPPRKPQPLVVPAAEFRWPERLAVLSRALRDYQEEHRLKFHEHFRSGAMRALGVAATGAGKTVFFAAATADVVEAGGRVLILTDQEELVDQAIDKLHQVAGIYAGAEQADRRASREARVVVATVQTLSGRLANYPPDHFALVVCDECDRSVAPTWQKVLAHFHDTARVLGVTATPKRADRKSILRYFLTKIFELALLELINRGYLVPVAIRELPLEIDLREAEDATSETADYNPEKLATAVERIHGGVCEAWKEHAQDMKTLVFHPDVATSKKFVMEAQRRGVNARHIDGTSNNRRELKQGFHEWRRGTQDLRTFPVLSNPVLLGRGYDEPSVECVINLRPTKSVSLYQQIVGRGTRLYCPHGCPGPCQHDDRKREVLVLDFLYQFKAMGPVRPSALFTDNQELADEMQKVLALQGKLDLREAMAQARTNMEKALVEAIAEAMRKSKGGKGEYYNALQFAATLEIPDVLDYVPETDEEAAPVPDRLKKKLSKAGFIADSVPYLGLAKKLLAAVEARREAGFASLRQVFWLRKWGYRDALTMDRERASQICAARFRR